MLKKILIVTFAVAGVLLAVPTIYPKASDFMPGISRPINLGLDLRGGAQLLLEIDVDTMMKDGADSTYDIVRALLLDRAKGVIRFADLKKSGDAITFTLRDADDINKARGRLRSAIPNVEVMVSGNAFSLRFTDAERERLLGDAIERSIEIIRRRIDEFGTKEPSIQRQGGRYILVQLPGVDNPERIKDLIGKTAKMTFHLVNEDVTEAMMISGARPPVGTEFLPSNDGGMIAIYSRVELSGENLVDSQATFDQQRNQPVVTQVFDSVGTRRFRQLTTENVNRRFAIVLDGRVLSAPVINEPIPGGRGQISGSFTMQSAQDLAMLLRSGALPAPLTIIEERTVGAGLGADTIRAGANAALVGLLIVMLFMIIVYGRFGVVANIALLVNLSMIIGISALFGATLTMPGIAGIILTLGMAVDANILPFERIRDEVKGGAAPLRAVGAGFDRAFKAVLDGNLTTLICALVLFQFGAGPIRGFAVTLSIGIFTTLFTCIALSRLMIDTYMNGKNKKIGFVKG